MNFERVSDVKAGESRTVKVTIAPSQMTVSDFKFEYVAIVLAVIIHGIMYG